MTGTTPSKRMDPKALRLLDGRLDTDGDEGSGSGSGSDAGSIGAFDFAECRPVMVGPLDTGGIASGIGLAGTASVAVPGRAA